MQDILCYNIDAESETGQPVAKRFAVGGYPALILLAPDGTPEDSIGGYLAPDKFKEEIRRVRSGKGTVGDLRRQVEADGRNVDKRFELARKLKGLGDSKGHDAQMAEIRKLDPEGKSLAMHRLAFEALVAKVEAGPGDTGDVDLDEVVAFLEKETYAEVLFDGWRLVADKRFELAQAAAQAGREADARKLQTGLRDAIMRSWKHCPPEEVVPYSKAVASFFYQSSEELTGKEKAFALLAARKAATEAPEDIAAIDVLACCLHMNGKKDEALQQVLRCMELEPGNKKWKARLEQFQK